MTLGFSRRLSGPSCAFLDRQKLTLANAEPLEGAARGRPHCYIAESVHKLALLPPLPVVPILEGLEHLGFRCTGCGNCCRDLRVAATHLDVARLAQATGENAETLVSWLSPNEVDMTGEPASFVELDVGRRLMVLGQRAGACRFLDSSLRCQVYAARPYDCRMYPFSIDLDPRSDGASASLSLLSFTKCEDGRDGCDSRFSPDGAEDARTLSANDHARFRELSEYQALVARWNRLARHRRRFGHRARSARDFYDFLESSTPILDESS